MTKPIRIIRAPHESKYFASVRATPQDRSLSWEARGVLWYLLSKSDNWEVQPKDLQQGVGRDKVYKILKELIDANYIERVDVREKGKFVSTTYLVYEQPYTEKPDTVKTLDQRITTGRNAKQSSEMPDTVLPDTSNTDIKDNREEQNTDQVKRDKEKTPAPKKGADESGFTHAQKSEVIAAWWNSLSIKPGNLTYDQIFKRKVNFTYAENLLKGGMTAYQMGAFVKAQTAPKAYYHDKALSFAKAAADAPAWVAAHNIPAQPIVYVTEQPTPIITGDANIEMPDDPAERERVAKALMAKVGA